MAPCEQNWLHTLLFCLLLAVLAVGAASGDEVRGGWVTAWNPGLYTPKEVDATIAAAKSAKLNALFVQVRKVADAYYDSSIEPRGTGIAADFDPLAYMIEKAHAQGIQVHAWVNVYRVWKDKAMPKDPNHIVNRHPEWLNRTNDGETRAGDGLFLDPGIPEARDYIASVTEEIARKYAVDGIHLDYVRYPGNTWGYSSIALSRYYTETGAGQKPASDDPAWLNWRRDQVTELVRLVRQKVEAARPGTKITAATVPWGRCTSTFDCASPYKTVCQDWQKWLTDGLLDANVPMDYKDESTSAGAQQFRDWLAGFQRWSGGKPVYVGIDVHSNRTMDVLKQIDAVRKAGLNGFVLFSFNQTPLRDALVNAMQYGSAAAYARSIHSRSLSSVASRGHYVRGKGPKQN